MSSKYTYRKVGEVRVHGRDLEAAVNLEGRWVLQEPAGEGDRYPNTIGSGDSIEAAKRDARKELKKLDVEVEVPFLIAKNVARFGEPKEIKVETGVATKFRTGDERKVSVRIEGEKDEIGGGYSRRGDVWRPETPHVWRPETPHEQIHEYHRLKEEQNDLYKKQEAIEEEWRLDLTAAVKEAIDAEVEVREEEEPEEIAPAEEVEVDG